MVHHKKKINIKCHLSKEIVQRDKLIKMISKSSNRYGDKLLDFMEQYNLSGLNKASTRQLEEYIKNNDLK